MEGSDFGRLLPRQFRAKRRPTALVGTPPMKSAKTEGGTTQPPNTPNANTRMFPSLELHTQDDRADGKGTCLPEQQASSPTPKDPVAHSTFACREPPNTAPNLQAVPGGVNQYSLVDQKGQCIKSKGYKCFFVDEKGVLKYVKKYITIVEEQWEERDQIHGWTSVPPLFINGQTKTGKTFLLRFILPACLAQSSVFGIGTKFQIGYLYLDLMNICKHSDYYQNLKALDYQLRGHEGEVVKEGVSMLELEESILRRLRLNSHCTCIQLDESQAWFNVPAEQLPAARLFFKALVQDSQRRKAIVAVTGSCLALFWLQMACLPTNGDALGLLPCKIDLPAVLTPKATNQIWNELEAQQSGLSPLFRKATCTSTPAVCVSLAQAASAQVTGMPSTPGDVWKFVQHFELEKLRKEAISDLKPAVRLMSLNQRLILLRLASSATPAQAASSDLRSYLAPYLEEIMVDGNQHLKLSSPFHVSAIKELINDDLTVRDDSILQQWVPLACFTAWQTLFLFGNAVADAYSSGGPQAMIKPFQGLAMHPYVQRQNWTKQAWVEILRADPSNQRGTSAHFGKRRNAGAADTELVAITHIMVRNILAHAKTEHGAAAAVLMYPFASPLDIGPMLNKIGRAI